jgi:hypothetical protein
LNLAPPNDRPKRRAASIVTRSSPASIAQMATRMPAYMGPCVQAGIFFFLRAIVRLAGATYRPIRVARLF